MATATTEAVKDFKDELGAKSPEEVVSWLNVLIYGEPGVGKTYLCGTAMDDKATSPVLFLDVEGGVTTLRKRKGLDVVAVRSIEQVVNVHNKIKMNKEQPYKTVIVDSLSELQRLDMNEIMKTAPGVEKGSQDEDVPSMREWGKNSNRIRKIVRAYRDLPMNTIFTAHAVIDRDSNNALTYAPNLPGKLRAELPGFLDIVGLMTTFVEEGETIRRVQFAKTKTVIAKDRTAALGDLLDNTTIPEMWKLIHES